MKMLHLQVNLTTSSLQRLIVSQKQELRSQFRSSSDIYFTVPTIYTVLKNCNYKWTGKAYFKIWIRNFGKGKNICLCTYTCKVLQLGDVYVTCKWVYLWYMSIEGGPVGLLNLENTEEASNLCSISTLYMLNF